MTPQDLVIVKGSGYAATAVAATGLTADLSGWSEVAQIVANFGIGLAALTAFLTFIYTVYKGRKKKDDN